MKLDLANISPTEVDTAYNYLAETDAEFAQLYAAKDALKKRISVVEASEFLASRADTVAERRADAECSTSVRAYIDDWENAVADHKLLEARRQRAHTVIDLWRTMEASRRRT